MEISPGHMQRMITDAYKEGYKDGKQVYYDLNKGPLPARAVPRVDSLSEVQWKAAEGWRPLADSPADEEKPF
jgi:hypothetical protein